MRRVEWAQRILGVFTERERAACIAGDLAESAETRGAIWFWRGVAGTAFGLGWRPALIFLACIAGQVAVVFPSAAIMNARSAANHGRSLAPEGPILSLSAMLLVGIAVYALFRHGVGHRLTRLAGVLTVAAFVGGCLQGTPYVARATLFAIVVVLVAAAFARSWRRALGGLMAGFAASAVLCVAIVMINSRPKPILLFPVNQMLIVGAQRLACRRVRQTAA